MSPPKVLKHCSICRCWGAAYLVNDKHLGKLLLCGRCWKTRTEALAAGAAPTCSQPAALKAEPEPPQPTAQFDS